MSRTSSANTSYFFVIVILSILNHSVSFAENDWRAYYGPYYRDFDGKVENPSRDNELKSRIWSVLNKFHLVRDQKPDEIRNQCPKEKPEGAVDCYRRHVLSYGHAKDVLYAELHSFVDENNRRWVEDVYGQRPLPYTKKKAAYNTEHSWPQSRFTNAPHKLQHTDLHHLFPSEIQLNQMRSSREFAEVTGPPIQIGTGECSLGKREKIKGLTPPEQDGQYFEPPTKHRGNLARALFHFAVRYGAEIRPAEEYFLRKWHSEDPVDAEEKERNEKIYQIQKDRNAFIDYPDLVERIEDF